jgi:hypothetical protein
VESAGILSFESLNMNRSTIIHSWLVGLSMSLGCDPSDGAGSDSDTNEVIGQACIESVTVIDADTVTALGFSAEAMLEDKLGTTKKELVFLDEQPAPLSTTIAGRTFPLEVTLAWDGGEVRWIESEVDPDHDFGEQLGGPDPGCYDRVEVDVSLSLVTADRELDEQLRTTLTARTRERAELTDEGSGADLYPPDLQGELDPATIYDSTTVTVQRLSAAGTWLEDRAGGAIMVELLLSSDDAASDLVGFGRLARWGDEIPPAP